MATRRSIRDYLMSAVYAPPEGMGCHEATYSICKCDIVKVMFNDYDSGTISNFPLNWRLNS